MSFNRVIVRVLLGATVLLAAGIALSTPYVNEDLFLAFAAGRDISQGLVAAPDKTAFTVEREVWVNQAWLSHYLLYLTHEWLGPTGPVALKVMLFGCCFFLIWKRCRRLGSSVESTFAALIPGILASGTFLGIRGENFGLFLFILFTSLLAAEPLSKNLRRFAIPLTIVAWANFHGSFVLGLGLLYMKCLAVAWRRLKGGPPALPVAAEWCVIAAISTFLPGLFSPFGMDNLLMPFKQVGTSSVTQYSADWLPLWSLGEVHQGFLGGGSVYPYLILLGLLVVFAAIAVMCKISLASPGMAADWAMEVIIASVTVIMAFRFRRLALFSALSLVPVLSLYVQAAANHLRTRGSERRELTGGSESSAVTALVASAACLVLMTALFWRAAIIPYLPENPFRPDRPLMRELMSFDSFSSSLVKFLKTNGLGEANAGERFLAGWEVSPYLMYSMPQIKLFMDCRDQSFYPPRVVTDFFIIMGILPPRGRDALDLLDDYRVTSIVLTTGIIDFQAGLRLMQSRRWVCLYADPKGIVLVRPDSARFREAVQSGLTGLWFPDDDSRILSRALLSHFMFGRIAPGVVDQLKAVVKRSPWPNYYALLTWGMDRAGACFQQSTVEYLVSEALRLSAIYTSRDRAGAAALESLVRIYGILEENAARCGEPENALRFRNLKISAQNQYDRLWDRFLGRFL